MQGHWMFVGAITAACAVATGAIGAHGIESFLTNKHTISATSDAASKTDDQIAASSKTPTINTEKLIQRRIGNWNTAATYQMYHALGIILVGLTSVFRTNKSLQLSGWCFLVGIVLFSGSLYVLVLTEVTMLGAIVPVGGVSFIVGWVAFGLGTCCMPATNLSTDPQPTQLS